MPPNIPILPRNYLIHNRYRIMRLLGEGGFGHVYEATDETFDRDIALKETLVEDEKFKKAFEREAKLLAKLNHPNIPRVTDYFFDGRKQYLVMDLIEGLSLEELLKLHKRPPSYEEVLPWAYQILDALNYLHNIKPYPVIHRDIKPANIRISKEGKVSLVDFGIAKGKIVDSSDDEYAPLSSSVRALSPAYSSLEQITGAGTDARSDIFSFGATLYHLLTGHLPAWASERYDRFNKGQGDPLILPHKRNPSVPEAISAVLLQAMSLNSKERFASAAEMRQALQEAAPLAPKSAESSLPEPINVGKTISEQTTKLPDRIFICYRREDSAPQAYRLNDWLGNRQFLTFMDIDTIPYGVDFRQAINEELESCTIVLVLIGKQWVTSERNGQRRLDNPNDLVRLEIANALSRGIRVIPILVQDANMPSANDLPNEIKALAYRQALSLNDIRWKDDVERLVRALNRTLADLEEKRRKEAEHKLAEEETRKREEEAKREVEEARQKAEREERRRQEAEEQRREEEARARAEEEARRKREAEEAEAARQAEAERQRQEQEAKQRAEEEAKQRAEEERRLAEEAARRAEEQRRGDEERRRQEAEERGRLEAEEVARRAEEERQRVEQERLKREALEAERKRAAELEEKERAAAAQQTATAPTQQAEAHTPPDTFAVKTIPAPPPERAVLPGEKPAPRVVAPAGRNRRIMLIGVAVLFALVIVITVVLMPRSKSNQSSNANQAQTVQEASTPATNSNGAAATLPAPSVTPPTGMVYVPGGEFTMGRDGDPTGYESPAHKVTVKPFFIDQYEVTREDYQKCVDEKRCQPPSIWGGNKFPAGTARLPVTGVTWDDANAYAKWAGKRLPTEEEWEFAARGTDGRRYPWGNDWGVGLANADPAATGMVDVGSYPAGRSPFNVFDMVGNAWEWTTSPFQFYHDSKGRMTLDDVMNGLKNLKVIRGCMYQCSKDKATTTFRRPWPANGNYDYSDTGFRCAKDATK